MNRSLHSLFHILPLTVSAWRNVNFSNASLVALFAADIRGRVTDGLAARGCPWLPGGLLGAARGSPWLPRTVFVADTSGGYPGYMETEILHGMGGSYSY